MTDSPKQRSAIDKNKKEKTPHIIAQYLNASLAEHYSKNNMIANDNHRHHTQPPTQ